MDEVIEEWTEMDIAELLHLALDHGRFSFCHSSFPVPSADAGVSPIDSRRFRYPSIVARSLVIYALLSFEFGPRAFRRRVVRVPLRLQICQKINKSWAFMRCSVSMCRHHRVVWLPALEASSCRGVRESARDGFA